MAAKNQKKTCKKARGGFKIELNLNKTLTLGGFVIMAMVWSFILGVFVGRGYNPEDVLPDIARILPDSSPGATAPKVLRPEDLDFFDRLRSSPSGQKTPQPAREPVATLTAPEPAIQARPDPPAVQDRISEAETFIYSYQVASFQTMQRAANLQQKLMDEGFSAGIADAFIDNEPWYRVIVEFESSDQGSDRFLKKLETHGITRPVFRGKRPS